MRARPPVPSAIQGVEARFHPVGTTQAAEDDAAAAELVAEVVFVETVAEVEFEDTGAALTAPSTARRVTRLDKENMRMVGM